MRFIRTAVFVFIIVAVSSAQYRGYAHQSGIGIPYFRVSVHQQFQPDLKHTRLLVMCELLNDDLTFIKSSKNGFDAEFELIYAIYDKEDEVVASRTVKKQVNAAYFDLTNNRENPSIYKEEFNLFPGKYTVMVKSIDLNSNKVAQRKVDIIVDDFVKKDISISSVLFLQKAHFDSTGKMIAFQPSFENSFSVRSGLFYIYFDLYQKNTLQPVDLSFKIYNKKKETEIDSSLTYKPTKEISSFVINIDRNRLKRNNYTLEINVKEGKNTVKKTQTFSFFWSEVPGTVDDIATAIKQMSYILNTDTLNRYIEADFPEQKAFFKRFWKDRDPNPATKRNELKDEYFNRVNYANQHFKALGEKGWKSDRGRILIKFGYPDDIERHPFEIDSKPYEIWRYYSLRKVFYFIDVTGFGDYRLHPDYIDMEFQ